MSDRRHRHAWEIAFDEIERQFDESREGFVSNKGDGTDVLIDGRINLKKLVDAITKRGEYDAGNRKV